MVDFFSLSNFITIIPKSQIIFAIHTKTPKARFSTQSKNKEGEKKKLDNEIKMISINKIKWLTFSHDYPSGIVSYNISFKIH